MFSFVYFLFSICFPFFQINYNDDDDMQLCLPNTNNLNNKRSDKPKENEDDEENDDHIKRNEFRSYLELKASGTDFLPGVKLADNHNYFKRMNTEVKDIIINILEQAKNSNDENGDGSNAEQCFIALTTVLNMQYKLTELDKNKKFLEVKGHFHNLGFIGEPTKIYQRFIDYLDVMIH